VGARGLRQAPFDKLRAGRANTVLPQHQMTNATWLDLRTDPDPKESRAEVWQ